MSTEIQPFTFPTTGQPVRTVDIDGEPWFVGKDACDVVGISKYRDALAQLDTDERASVTVDTPGGPQSMTVVNEAGIYSLMMISRSPVVRDFKRWLTHEVIPAVRKTGFYSAPVVLGDPLAELEEANARLGQAISIARTERKRAEVAEQHVAELEPAAQARDTLSNANGDYSLREAAQILSRDPGVATIGQNRLLKYLREIRWVDFHSTPYQDQVDIGRLVRRTDTYDHPHTGEAKLYTQVRITPKGLAELRNRLRAAAQPMLTGASR